MLKLTIAVTGLIAAALAASACGSSQVHHARADKPQTATSEPPTAPATPRLTRAQSRARYLQIINPNNAAVDAVSRDMEDAQPWPQTARDLRAAVAGFLAVNGELAAVRWAPRVQPFVQAEITTYDPSVIACFRSQAASGSNAAATTVSNGNSSCQLAQASTIPDQIRTLLQLPGRD